MLLHSSFPPPRVVSPLCLLLTVRWEGAEGRGGHGLAAQPDVVRLPGQAGVSVLGWAGLCPAETWCLAVLPGANCEATQPGLWILTARVEGLHPARYYTGCSTRPSCMLMACDSPYAAHAGPVHFYFFYFFCSTAQLQKHAQGLTWQAPAGLPFHQLLAAPSLLVFAVTKAKARLTKQLKKRGFDAWLVLPSLW